MPLTASERAELKELRDLKKVVDRYNTDIDQINTENARYRQRFLLALAALVTVSAVIGLSYAFAAAGEPQSVWLWRDVFGVIG